MRIRLVTLSAALLAAIIPASADAARLRAPAMVAPSADATTEGVPTFTWNPVRHAARYEFQLAADRAFGSVVLGTGRGAGSFKTQNTAATIDKSLPDGEYFWRVRAISANDRAGAWSAVRSLTKAWATAPQLLAPLDELSVSWPADPLVLEWVSVPRAVTYQVSIATDPSLSSPVVGTAAEPRETQGTTFALPTSLAPGRYYWAVTPVDAQGHKGTRSRVGTFTWSWPTATPPRFNDLNPDPRVMDPEFSWDAVPGAARYEVEINPDQEFAAGSRVLGSNLTTGTSFSPLTTLPDNTYHWRVRAIDVDGNAGVWNRGPDFTKNFDAEPGQPSIRNLRVRDNTDLTSTTSLTFTSAPVVVWDPVPGASGYEVQGFLNCDHSQKIWDDFTATPAWTPLGPSEPNVGPESWKLPTWDTNIFPASGTASYCVSVRAYTDRPGSNTNGYVSLPTEASFSVPALPAADSETPAAPQSSDYLATSGVVTARMPVFTWNAIPHAWGYYVVVARDPDFISVVDHVFTRIPAYAPRGAGAAITYSDETTSYYWAVIPFNPGASPRIPPGAPPAGARADFKKQSVPPTLLTPAAGAAVTTQPRFSWTPAEGARKYTLQVAHDPSFGEPIDTVVTDSTSYTSSTTYPADTVLYWRVSAKDETGTILTWSQTGAFRRELPVPLPTPGNPSGGEGIPVLSWTPVPGAVSYDMHVDQVDGTTRDFTLRSTSFTPTLFYGTGIWKWKVRANFPRLSGGTVSGAYFAPLDYVRRIGAPTGVVGTKTSTRTLISWKPDPVAKQYRVQVSSTSGFGQLVESATTDNTSWAPDLAAPAYQNGGRLYWRVALVDRGGNNGAFASGSFVFPRAMRIVATKLPARGGRTPIRITLKSVGGRAIRGATVRISGKRVRARKRTGRKGTATFLVRTSRRGTLTVSATARGYRNARTSVRLG